LERCGDTSKHLDSQLLGGSIELGPDLLALIFLFIMSFYIQFIYHLNQPN